MVNQHIRILTVVVGMLLTAAESKSQVVQLVDKLVISSIRTKPDDLDQLLGGQPDEAIKRLSTRLSLTDSDTSHLERRFDRLPGATPSIRTEFRTLTKADQRLAVELGEASHSVLRRAPNTQGLLILRELDTEGLALARVHGDIVLDASFWLRSDDVVPSIESTVLSQETRTAIATTLGLKFEPGHIESHQVIPLWRAVLLKTGDGAKTFWQRWVAPHQSKWLTGGILAVYLAMPELFHDELGQLREEGTRRLRDIGIVASTDTLEGKNTRLVNHFKQMFNRDPSGTILRLLLTATLFVLVVPSLRRFLWKQSSRIARWPFRRKQASNTPNYHSPFRE